jgi:hypothetical protein
MKLVFVVLMLILVSTAQGQTPSVKIYFDEEWTIDYADCPDAPAGTVRDTLYVVVVNFDMWLSAVEYQIEFPPTMMFLADLIDDSALKIGSSPAGIWIAWTAPQNAFEPFLLQRVMFVWNCDDCTGVDETVAVVPFPHSGKVRAVRWHDNAPVEGVGSVAGICKVPPRESTWGGIKALYE